jgi:N-acetyl-anhydromuramyl-L-alanine amidase AmpD
VNFVQARNFRRGRRGDAIDLIVLHSMEAPDKPNTAEAVAAWFAGPHAPKASAHYCVDQDSTVQCVRDCDEAWHARGANHNGIGIEHAGHARQTEAEWLDDESARTLARSVELCAALCRAYAIPPVFVDAAGLLRGQRGITTHAEVSRAWRRSSHWDPGPGFPLASYVARVADLVRADIV